MPIGSASIAWVVVRCRRIINYQLSIINYQLFMNQPSLLTDWNIVGHRMIVDRLSRAVANQEVSHAYLFAGPDHVGKSTLARIFAQALLCTSEGHRPCGQCRACGLVAANRHPDLLTLNLAWQEMIFATKGTATSVSVDAVRQMNTELSRRPHDGRYKILLIPDAETLTTAAANAFLKTLEEPPAYVIILLTVRDLELLLPTIRSRCQPLHLSTLPLGEIEQVLMQAHGVSPDQAKLLARLSGGRIGWAINAVQDRNVLNQRASTLATLYQLIRGNRAERLLLAASLAKSNDMEVMALWASWWRDVLLIQNGAVEAIQNSDQRDLLERAALDTTPHQVRTFLHDLQRLRKIAQETNANPMLVWENLVLKLPIAG
jgi:DNA polymerase-3 subunit delta'